jgi:hypothetical protein
MLMLALLPCGDEVECVDSDRYEISFTNNNHQDHANHAENCSPFCICACCGQVLNVASAYHFNVKPRTPIGRNLISYSDPYFEIIPQSIWQPPKLV